MEGSGTGHYLKTLVECFMSPITIGGCAGLLAVAKCDCALLLYYKLDWWWITTLMATIAKGLLLRFSTTAPVVVSPRLQVDKSRLFVKNDRFTHNTSPSISLLLVPVLFTLFASLFRQLAAERRQIVHKITQWVRSLPSRLINCTPPPVQGQPFPPSFLPQAAPLPHRTPSLL